MGGLIDLLPFELLARILEEAVNRNAQDIPTFSYGLTQTTGKDGHLQLNVRGSSVPDALRWRATGAVRQVNRQWHDWAAEYALRDLYITRWRGSERWMQSRNLDTLQGKPSPISVYRDPYHSLKNTSQLFSASPGLGTCVRRIWFNGYNTIETVRLIFEVLKRCTNLSCVTLPWTTLRYGTKEDWSQLLGRKSERRKNLSLGFLAVDLSGKEVSDARNQVDEVPLDSTMVDFSSVHRLKIFGNSNLMPITNRDLFAIARTARNLQEIHITGTSTVTIDGVMALVDASRDHLQVLEHSPLSNAGFEHPDPAPTQEQGCLCGKLLQCRHLRDLSISLPSLCEELFRDPIVNWRGEVQIRASTLCNHYDGNSDGRTRFWRIPDLARCLMAAKDDEGVELDIQLFIDYWIFEPRHARVHGNVEVGLALSDGLWPQSYAISSKGPYGQTGLYGKDERPYSCILEPEYVDGLRRGYVSFFSLPS